LFKVRAVTQASFDIILANVNEPTT